MKGYKAFLIDLDGTLIGKEELISCKVSKVVRRVSNSLNISITTGREPADAIRFARELGLTTPQISDNGAVILDPGTGKELWSAPLSPRHARQILITLRRLRAEFLATFPGGTVTDFRHITNWNMTRISALDMDQQQANELVARFESNSNLHVVKASLPYNGLWAVDFTNVGVNKASAACVLAGMFGIDINQIIAAGDSYNDLSLLQASGLSIAMGNAPEELKAIADYIAPPVEENGLATAIERFVLPKL